MSDDSMPESTTENQTLEGLLHAGDLDALLRLLDDACDNCDWVVVERIAKLARNTNDRGFQLWPAADHAEHRLALGAPAEYAARAVARDSTRFGIAPLAEVAASNHTWVELEPFLPEGLIRATVAQERVARGEDLSEVALEDDPLDMPLRLSGWEPTYDGAAIGAFAVEDPIPTIGPLLKCSLPPAGVALPHPGIEALRDLTRTWTVESEGFSAAVYVRGSAASAIATLGQTDLRMRELQLTEALGQMAWAAASGGVHGRRRGAARGRFEAWWCAACLAEILNDPKGIDIQWPPEPERFKEAVSKLVWWLWDDGNASLGWHLQIAIENPDTGFAWALEATDRG